MAQQKHTYCPTAAAPPPPPAITTTATATATATASASATPTATAAATVGQQQQHNYQPRKNSFFFKKASCWLELQIHFKKRHKERKIYSGKKKQHSISTAPGLGVVLEHLEGVLLPGGLLRALDHLPVDAQAEDVGADDVVVDQRGGLDLEPGAGGAYHGQEQLVNGGQPLLGGLLHLAAAATEGGGSAGAARLQHKKVSKMSDNRRSPENNSRGEKLFFSWKIKVREIYTDR